MWELMTKTVDDRDYVCEFLREDTTDPKNIARAWIRILTIKRNGKLIYEYRYGHETDLMDELDRSIFQAVLDNFNQL
ncbi:TPA: hypothetical protein U3P08_001938 [Streptococcus agalactiae]|nr:hypothetical protein [Streptococcus agalactiae]